MNWSDEEGITVDQFAGGGGASYGVELATGHSPHIAINHDRAAIEMHSANHPDTFHYTEDVWHISPKKACRGQHVRFLWSSPDCTHFSKAKGGTPVKQNIRGLAWVVVKWARQVRPDILFLENVSEFQSWGPLIKITKHGQIQYAADGTTPKYMPDPKRRGQTFRRWVKSLRELGYNIEWRVLNAADYGVPTDRRRLFVIARCDGRPIVWPEPTHTKPDKYDHVPAGMLPWRTAAECINWDFPSPSIFLTAREARQLQKRAGIRCQRPLKKKTMWRTANGLARYVINSSKPFIVRTGHYSNITGEGGSFRGQGVDEPLATVCGTNDKAIISPVLTEFYSNGGMDQAVDSPLNTVTARDRFALTPAYLIKANHGGAHMRGRRLDEPLHTITASRGAGVVAPVLQQIGHRDDNKPGPPVEQPLPTVTAVDHNGLVAAHLSKMRGDSKGASAEDPLPTITSGAGAARPAGAAHSMGVVTAILAKFYGTSKNGTRVDHVAPTVTAQSKHLGLVEAVGLAVDSGISEKDIVGFLRVYKFLQKYLGKAAPLPIVRVNGYEYLICDVGLRMLKPCELLNAQFTPELAANYKLTGSNANQVAKIGNSVPPLVVKCIVEANIGKRKALVA